MTEPAPPIHEFVGAIYGHFFPDEQGRPSALSEAVHRALRDERAAGLAVTLMDYLAGDVEVQWIGEDEAGDGRPSFTMPVADSGGLDLARLARERPDIYAEAFQVAVGRLSYRERPAYGAYFALVLEAFEALFGPNSAPLRAAPAERRPVSRIPRACPRSRGPGALARRRSPAPVAIARNAGALRRVRLGVRHPGRRQAPRSAPLAGGVWSATS